MTRYVMPADQHGAYQQNVRKNRPTGALKRKLAWELKERPLDAVDEYAANKTPVHELSLSKRGWKGSYPHIKGGGKKRWKCYPRAGSRDPRLALAAALLLAFGYAFDAQAEIGSRRLRGAGPRSARDRTSGHESSYESGHESKPGAPTRSADSSGPHPYDGAFSAWRETAADAFSWATDALFEATSRRDADASSAWPLPGTAATQDTEAHRGGHRDDHHRVYKVAAPQHRARHRHRGDDHRHEEHHEHDGADLLEHNPNTTRTARTYPHKLNDFINSLGPLSTFEALIGRKLRRLGYDPDELLDVYIFTLSAYKKRLHAGGRLAPERIRAIDLARQIIDNNMDFLFQGASDRADDLLSEIKNSDGFLDNDKFFEDEATRFTNEQVDVISTPFKHKAHKLDLRMHHEGRFGYIRAFNDPDSMLSIFQPIRGELSIFFEREIDGITRRFLIDIHTDELIREIPTNNAEFQSFMKNGGVKIAFRYPLSISDDAIFSANHFSPDKYDLKFGFEMHLAAPNIKNIVRAIADITNRPALAVEVASWVAGIFIPGWDVALLLASGDTTQAFIFIGLELIPIVGKGGKVFVKAMLAGHKVPAKLAKAAAIGERIAEKTFDPAKTVYGAFPQVEAWANDVNGN